MADNSRILRTPVCRMSYPNLVKARVYEDKKKGIKGDPRYSCDFLLEPADLEKFQVLEEGAWGNVSLKAVLAAAAREAWPGMDVKEAVKHGGIKWPITDGNVLATRREAEGKKNSDLTKDKFTISASTKEEFAPQLFVLQGGEAIELDRNAVADKATIQKLFVGGQYVVAGLKLKPNETPQGKFLTFYLNSVLYVKKGERIGGMTGETMFAGIEGGEADLDPTEGLPADLDI